MTTISATHYKKTKIIATVGPASEAKIEPLLMAGVNGIRLNFSHGTHESHAAVIQNVRAAAKKLDRAVAIIQDLQGPKIRVGELPDTIEVHAGDIIKLRFGASYQRSGIIPVQYDISRAVKVGDRLFIRDGQITARIERLQSGTVTAAVTSGGKFGSNHGINLPDTVFHNQRLTEKDLADLRFGLTQDIDYVALSFVHTARDVEKLKDIIAKRRKPVQVIVKIETGSAADNLHEIIKAADVVMIARGDLATETSPQAVPIIGRKIIHIAREEAKPVIMATQMLESMITSPQPTRAEANDVATAVSLGVDSVMLSGETAIGTHPVETVKMMKRIILTTEQYMREVKELGRERGLTAADDTQDALSLAAVMLARHVGAKLILAETASGDTARAVAATRPDMAIIMASFSERVCNQLAIVWGSKPFKVRKTRYVSANVLKKLRERRAIKAGDQVVAVFGTHAGRSGATDTVRILTV